MHLLLYIFEQPAYCQVSTICNAGETFYLLIFCVARFGKKINVRLCRKGGESRPRRRGRSFLEGVWSLGMSDCKRKRCTCNIDRICSTVRKEGHYGLVREMAFFLALFKMSWNREEIGPVSEVNCIGKYERASLCCRG